MKKLLFSMVAIFCFSFLCNAEAADNNAHVIINGDRVVFNDDTGYPYVDENFRTMVPLRVTMEATGAAVGYDNDKQTAIVITGHDRIEIPIGTNVLYNNNVKIQNDTESVTKDGRTYLPIRAVLESADYTVEWDEKTNAVSAYNFTPGVLYPYSTSSIETLADDVLSGRVIYIDGQYYATPDYVKALSTTEMHYFGADLNIAIYPEANRYISADVEIVWPSDEDNNLDGIQ